MPGRHPSVNTQGCRCVGSKKKGPAGVNLRALRSTWEAIAVSSQTPRRRKVADASKQETVKCTVLLRVEVHARLAAAAALRKCDRSTFAAECIENGLKGLIVIDKRKPSNHVDSS